MREEENGVAPRTGDGPVADGRGDEATVPRVEVVSLCKEFGALRALHKASFNVAQGEILGFLGPNGAGKSTTMKIITGFLEPTSGTVRINGHDVIQQPLRVKAATGYLPEGAPCYRDMTVRRFLSFIAEVRGFGGAEKKRRIAAAIDTLHLEDVTGQTIETLSKGYKRRVGLAQAILHDPSVLIMDEPTDGLDPNQKHEVRTLIKDMAKDKVIIISTHILEEVDAVCTRAILIARGELLFDGTPELFTAHSDTGNIDEAFRRLTQARQTEPDAAPSP